MEGTPISNAREWLAENPSESTAHHAFRSSMSWSV
jgi:hypothetical protein